MDQYEYMRIAHRVYKKGIRRIARETGHSRKTIRKVLRGKEPRYKKRGEEVYPVLGPYRGAIEGWLSADQGCRANQRHTARRIYHRLVEEHGFGGSESNVRRYVRLVKARLGVSTKEAFIPLDPESSYGFRPGRSAHDAVRNEKVKMGQSYFFDKSYATRCRFLTAIRNKMIIDSR
jgi:hypothetical protein